MICLNHYLLIFLTILINNFILIILGPVNFFNYDRNWFKQVIQCLGSHINNGGEGGIRTHETLARPTVFKTGAFDHSADFTDFI